MGDRQWFVLYVLVCFEVGIFLLLVPWSAIWERNYFLDAYPSLRPILLSPTLKGAVCGLGVANIYVGVTEVLRRLSDSGRRGTIDAADAIRAAEMDVDIDDDVEPTSAPRTEPVHDEL